MSQHDFNIADALTPAFRTDLNLALVALAENSGGSTEPSTMFAGQTWLDKSATNTTWKMRSAANDAWITLGVLDETNNLFIPDFNGLSFSNLDLIFHDGTDFEKLAVGTALQVLRVNAGATALEWGSAGSGFSSIQTFASSGTWTRPTGIIRVKIFITDAGSAGTSSSSGAAGDTSITTIDVSAISSSTITVGTSQWADGTNTITSSSGADLVISGGASVTTGTDANRSGNASYWGDPPAFGAGGKGGVSIGSGGLGVIYVEEYK